MQEIPQASAAANSESVSDTQENVDSGPYPISAVQDLDEGDTGDSLDIAADPMPTKSSDNVFCYSVSGCLLGQGDTTSLAACSDQADACLSPGAALESSPGTALEPLKPSAPGNSMLLHELHARAAAQAAQEIGLSASAAMAAMPLLPDMQSTTQAAFAMAGMAPAETAADPEKMKLTACGAPDGVIISGGQQNEQSFTCTVCRKVFKREMNLIFHMTTHRPRQPQSENTDVITCQPVKCQDCGKEFATKYQAKKHYLRRHFSGEKPFGCPKCHKKRFVVKEDLTMHMKSCGNVYVCTCGIRLCSLGALKRHCKYFSHEPESLEPKPDPSVSGLDWNGSLDVPDSPAGCAAGGQNAVSMQRVAGMSQGMCPGNQMHLQAAFARMSSGGGIPPFPSTMQQQHGRMCGGFSSSGMHCQSGALPNGGMLGGHLGASSANSTVGCSANNAGTGCGCGGGGTGAGMGAALMREASLMRSLMGQGHENAMCNGDHQRQQPLLNGGHFVSRDYQREGQREISRELPREQPREQQWTAEMLSGIMPSLAQALRQAQYGGGWQQAPQRCDQPICDTHSSGQDFDASLRAAALSAAVSQAFGQYKGGPPAPHYASAPAAMSGMPPLGSRYGSEMHPAYAEEGASGMQRTVLDPRGLGSRVTERMQTDIDGRINPGKPHMA